MAGLNTNKETSLNEEQIRLLRPLLNSCLDLNHDLNNPLAGIIGYCEFLMEDSGSLSEEQLNYLAKILICAERIRVSLEGLGAQKMEIGQQVDLNEFLKDG